MTLINKVVLIVGGSDGIGASTAVRFTKELANVAIVGRNEEKLLNVSEKCEKCGKKPLIIKADITKEDELKKIFTTVIDVFGKLDVLVKSAAVIKFCSVLDEKILNVYDEIMQTNLRALFHVTNLAAPYLIKTKGNIVIVSGCGSMSTVGAPHLAAFLVSEAGRDHFTRCTALELASSGVRVNSVNPGPVNTKMIENCGGETQSIFIKHITEKTALGRISEPEEIAELILFLASDNATSITGSSFVIDNGFLLKN